MFFLANVCSTALYFLGVVEAVVSDFGVRVGKITVGGATPAPQVLLGSTRCFLQDTGGLCSTAPPCSSSVSWSVWLDHISIDDEQDTQTWGGGGQSGCELTALSLQVGAHTYARATFVVFIIVTTVLVSVFVSFFVVAPLEVTLPESSVWNGTGHGTANSSGFQRLTLEGNLMLGLLLSASYTVAGSHMSGQMFYTPVISCWSQIHFKVLNAAPGGGKWDVCKKL